MNGGILYETPAFYTALVVILALAYFFVQRLRVQRIHDRNMALQAEMAERQRQNRLFVEVLRAESTAHLLALGDELHEVINHAEKSGAPRSLPVGFLTGLGEIFDALTSLELQPGNENRALVMGEAYNRALALKDEIDKELDEQSALGSMALDSICHVIKHSLQDLWRCADLRFRLVSKKVTARRLAVVVLELRNAGQDKAGNIHIRLKADDAAFHIEHPKKHLKSLLPGQAARFDFIVEPRGSECVELVFHAVYDDPERRKKELEFADVLELRHAGEAVVFCPLKPNPYVVGRPLLASDPFYGRGALFARIGGSLQGAEQDNVVVLIGQRRIGKTSLLRRLHHHLPASYVPVLVDLQGLLGTGERAFFSELAAQMVDELAEHGLEVTEPPAETFENEPGHVFRRQFLKSVRHALAGRRLLIVFDEMEVLEERIHAGELTPHIMPYLRSLIQHEGDLSFLLAGSHRLDELTTHYWSALFNIALHLDIGHLEREDIAALFTKPTRGSFEIDSMAIERAYRATGGHPHFSQLVARELVELCNQRRISYVTMEDIDEVVEIVACKGQLHIAYLWDEASADERLLLFAVKSLLENEGMASLPAAQHILTDRDHDPGDLALALRSLRRKEILTEEAGQLRFRIDLLRRWLDRHRDLETLAHGNED